MTNPTDITESSTFEERFPTPVTTIDAAGATRTLVEFDCACGHTVTAWLRDEDPHRCLDCRTNDDRNANGWTPSNSKD